MINFFRPRLPLSPEALARRPLVYTPRSTSSVNRERLNDADPNYYRSALGFREEVITEAEALPRLRWSIPLITALVGAFVYWMPLFLAAFGVNTFVLVFVVAPIFFGVVARFIFFVPLSRIFPAVLACWAVVPATALVVVVDLLTSGNPQEVAATMRALLMAGALVAGFATLSAAVRLHWQYLRQSPRGFLLTFDRAFARRLFLTIPRLAIALAIAFLGITLMVWISGRVHPAEFWGEVFAGAEAARGMLSQVTFDALMLPLAAASIWLLPRALRVFLTYDGRLTRAPGVWAPTKSSVRQRQLGILAAIAIAHLAVAVTHRSFLGVGPAEATKSMIEIQTERLDALRTEASARTENTSLLSIINSSQSIPQFLVRGVNWLNPGLTILAVITVLTAWATILSTIVVLAFASPATAGYVFSELVSQPNPESPTEWEVYTERLRSSTVTVSDPDGRELAERDHLYAGYEPFQRFPVLLHRPLFNEHAYIVGDTGSGKTSLGVMPLTMQLLRTAEDPAPLVVLDLKGDPAFLRTVEREAEARGQKFFMFTPEPWKHSAFFNPFENFETRSRTVIQVCQLFLEALGLNHGEGYGRGYYSKRSRLLLFDALKKNPQTFEELYEILEELMKASPSIYNDVFELVATIHGLTQYDQLVTKASQAVYPENTIHMPTLLAERQVAYFWLPAVIESMSVREIGKLALYALVSAAIDRQPRVNPAVYEPDYDKRYGRRQAFLVIDEFQRLAGENFKIILEQARSFGIGTILANQSISDLRTPTVDLRSTVRSNTRVKMYFSIQDSRELAELSAASGEEVYTQRTDAYTHQMTHGLGVSPISETVSLATAAKPRLTPTDLRAISDHPRRYVLHVARGSGFTQYAGCTIPVETTWPISYEEYEERASIPWPELPPEPAPLVGAPASATLEQLPELDEDEDAPTVVDGAVVGRFRPSHIDGASREEASIRRAKLAEAFKQRLEKE